MTPSITPIVFVGGSRDTTVERLITDAHEVIALDLLERLAESPVFDDPIVATSSPRFAAEAQRQSSRVVRDDGDFHFGRILAELIDRFDVRNAFYLGGGSAPLLSAEALSHIADLALAEPASLVANNFYSCDFVAFSPALAIRQIDLPAIDNDLAYRLHHEAGLKNVSLPRSAGTQLDVDTPTDLLILSRYPGIGPGLRRYLDKANFDTERVRAVGRILTEPTAEIVVAGRVGSYVLAHLEQDVACRTRVFSEERGMRANRREERGDVRSLLGYHLQTVGPRKFFADLASLGDAIVFDSRVIFHHLGRNPSASDRFYSDLLQPDQIEDDFVRAFTEAAAEATVPVLLGGHSVVAGGLWALIDAAWLERDREIEARSTS